MTLFSDGRPARICPRFLACALALPLLAPIVSADILCLKDGRIFEWEKLVRTESGVTIPFENGTVMVAHSLILEVIIEGNPGFEPRTQEEQEKFDKGLVPFAGRWMSVSKRDRLLDQRIRDRRQAIAEEQKHRLWRNRRTEKTKNFIFEYTVPQNIFESYRDQMETYFELFKKDWKVKSSRELRFSTTPMCPA